MSDTDRIKVGSRVEAEALERLRDAVAALQAAGSRISLETALTLGVKLAARHLERRFNYGARFPPRPLELRPGRRPRRPSLTAG